MPKELEKELKKRARQLHLNGKRKSACKTARLDHQSSLTLRDTQLR